MSDTSATIPATSAATEGLTMDQLLENQKEEQKKLTTKIIALRKGVPKSDKRKKREVASRIADLEYDLKKKHEEEVRVLKAKEAGLDPNAPEPEVSWLMAHTFKDESIDMLSSWTMASLWIA